MDGLGHTWGRGLTVYLLTVTTRGKGGKTAFMRVWSIGKTLASQAKETGSTPVVRSRQLNMEQEEDPRLFQDNYGCNEVAGGLFLFLGGGEGDCKKANGKGDRA